MILQLENIRKAYGTGRHAVEVVTGVNLSVEQNEFLAVMGPSGSGKSTLLQIMGLLDRPTSGRVVIGGTLASSADDAALAALRNRKIGFIFQSFRLLPQYSALDNVALPLVYAGVSDRRSRAKALLDKMGLGHRLSHRPSELSGGECQRVAICRALVNRPSFLLADEPTGALDTANGGRIMDIFHDLHRSGMTIVMVTHDPGVAKAAQRVVHFSNGNIQG
jgi:putative ABC transport system ATP-binding protein